MRRARILESTPFRIAAAVIVFAVGVQLLAAAVTYYLVRSNLDARRTLEIREIRTVISDTLRLEGLDGMIEAVRTNLLATRADGHAYYLGRIGGSPIIANMNPGNLPDGYSDVAGARIGLPNTFDYRIEKTRLGDYVLAIAISDKSTRELRAFFTENFAWAVIGTLAISLAGAAFMAVRLHRHFDDLRETFDQIAQGNLRARLPASNLPKDIAMLWQSINAALVRLENLVEGMRQVSVDIAHDLKTPLNRLMFKIEEARRGAAENRLVSGVLEEADTEVRHIDETFTALLAIAQIQSGSRKARFKAVDLSGLVQSMVEIYGEVAVDAGDELVSVIDIDEKVCIDGDAELLMRLLANLVENSIRHCPSPVRIVVRVSGQQGAGELGVEDNGPGIGAGERNKVLERFYRLEKSRTAPGTGLGLSLVKAIADLHSADMRLDDANPGLRVTIRFPNPVANLTHQIQ